MKNDEIVQSAMIYFSLCKSSCYCGSSLRIVGYLPCQLFEGMTILFCDSK
jgi:hypothetical protein